MSREKQAALFLDRDGVINRDFGYVYEPQFFQFVDDIFDLCQEAQSKNYKIIIVTNQSGIGRGIYSEEDYLKLSAWVEQQFAEQGVAITATYYCPHHPIKAKGDYLQDCDCRKPKPGLLLQAAQEHHLDLSRSLLVGDKLTDLQAAQAAGVPRRYWFVSKEEQIIDKQLVSAIVESHLELVDLL